MREKKKIKNQSCGKNAKISSKNEKVTQVNAFNGFFFFMKWGKVKSLS